MEKTIFLDIDGCIFKHKGNLSNQILEITELLPGVTEKINEWNAEDHKIILVTGRKESMRKFTEEQLLKHGIFYDQLIMGITGGERVLINDTKPTKKLIPTAVAITVERNKGLKSIII